MVWIFNNGSSLKEKIKGKRWRRRDERDARKREKDEGDGGSGSRRPWQQWPWLPLHFRYFLLFFFERNLGVGENEITEILLILTDGANNVRLGDLAGTKLIRWWLNVSNVYIEDENEMMLILWRPKRLINSFKCLVCH